MPDLPHLTIEELESTIRVLEVMRSSEGERANAYRVVLTDVHQVIRNARDISDGH